MRRTVHSLFAVASLASVITVGGTLALAGETVARPSLPREEGGRFGDCRNGKGAHGKEFVERLAKKLNLSDTQRAQVEAGFQKRHGAMKPLMTSLHSERKVLRTLVMSGTADEGAVRSQSAKVSAIETEVAVRRAQGAKEMIAILTPEQQEKFRALKGEWEEKMKKHHGDRRDGGGF